MVKLKFLISTLIVFVFVGCLKQSKTSDAEKIDSSKVAKVDSVKENNNFIFVGMAGYTQGLYKYNFESKKAKVFWSDPTERVVDLSYSADRKTAFFLTAKKLGKLGVFPFINGIRLYKIDIDSEKTTLITRIGSGMQVFTAWENENSFKVMLNYFDKKVATYVKQHTQIFNVFGKELVNETKTYDITKVPYPKPKPSDEHFISPDMNYKIVTKLDSGYTSVYLQNKDDKKNLITSGRQTLSDAGWFNGYLVFTTVDITPGNDSIYKKKPETSKLFIYSLTSKKIIKEFDGGGVKNFYLLNNYLIFDDGFDKNSSIKIFNFNSTEMRDTIKITNGCGLKNIPELPDYSA